MCTIAFLFFARREVFRVVFKTILCALRVGYGISKVMWARVTSNTLF